MFHYEYGNVKYEKLLLSCGRVNCDGEQDKVLKSNESDSSVVYLPYQRQTTPSGEAVMPLKAPKTTIISYPLKLLKKCVGGVLLFNFPEDDDKAIQGLKEVINPRLSEGLFRMLGSVCKINNVSTGFTGNKCVARTLFLSSQALVIKVGEKLDSSNIKIKKKLWGLRDANNDLKIRTNTFNQ
jgi:hypothetical protein